MDDQIERIRDLIALQDECAHVNRDLRERIGAAILADEANEDVLETAHRIIASLPKEDLAPIVADWLDSRTAI
jgi:hypothetical protein